ncbi:MAG: hypothetical protein KDK34_10935, partial [Leptospiraceae bacterium]|nr:hypothetical protein [Leptospiraceae bacterium]
ADRSEVLYLEEPDKPVHRKNSDRELEIISDSTDTQPDGNATQQQSGSSAGPEETTTNQSLWSQVPVDLRPLRLRHYRHFGSGQAARTLIAHARGRFLLLDASVAVPVSECMPLLDAMLGEDDGHPVQIRSASVGVDERTHKAVGTYPGPFWLWNRPAAELIYRQTRQNDRSQFLESLALLRKHRARIIWRHVAARSNDLARHQRIGALREWWRYHKGQLSVGLLLLFLIGAGIAIMLTLH